MVRKLLLILLSLVLCFFAFACTAEDDTSSATSTESKNESAVNSLDNETSDETSDNGESGEVSGDSSEDISNETSDDSSNVSDDSSDGEIIIPEFDINKVIYNPNENHYIENDERYLGMGFLERYHRGLSKYIKNNIIENDVWFCIMLSSHWNDDETKFELYPYIDEIGFIKDDALTESFRHNEYDDSVVGYITKEMFEKLIKDNRPIFCKWLPKSCVDAGGCHKVIE